MDFKAVEATAEKTKISGYASTNDPDRYDDIVEPSAFQEALPAYLQTPTLLKQHNPDWTIGRVVSAHIDAKGLFVDAEVYDEEMRPKVERKEYNAFSIGFRVLDFAFKHKATGVSITLEAYHELPYKEMLNYYRVITKLDLCEISIVAVPANPHARFTLQKSMKAFFDGIMKGVPENEIEPTEATTQEAVEAQPEAAQEVTPTEEVPAEPEAAQAPEEKAAEAQEETPTEPIQATITEPENAGEIPAAEDPQPIETPSEEQPSGGEGKAAAIETKDFELERKKFEEEIKGLQAKADLQKDAIEKLISVLAEKQATIANLTEKLGNIPSFKGLMFGQASQAPGSDATPEPKRQPGSLVKGLLAEAR